MSFYSIVSDQRRVEGSYRNPPDNVCGYDVYVPAFAVCPVHGYGFVSYARLREMYDENLIRECHVTGIRCYFRYVTTICVDDANNELHYAVNNHRTLRDNGYRLCYVDDVWYDETIESTFIDGQWIPDCIVDAYASECDECSTITLATNTYHYNGGQICYHCYEDHMLDCAECGDCVIDNDAYYDEDDGPLCEQCSHENQDIAPVGPPSSELFISIDPVWSHENVSLPQINYGLELETINVDNRYMDVPHWKCVYDGSLSRTSAELVSPVLRGVNGCGLDNIKETLEYVKSEYPQISTNTECGFHFHIDASTFGPEDMLRFALIAYHIQPFMFAVQPQSRRDNRYAQRFEHDYHDIICKAWNSRKPIKILAYQDGRFSACSDHYNSARYFFVNFHALQLTGTIEIRNHSGTLHYRKIENWIRLWLGIADYATTCSITPDTFGNQLEYDETLNYLHDVVGIDSEVCDFYQQRINRFSHINN